MAKFACKVTPLLPKAIGHTRDIISTQRSLLGKIESTVKDLRAKTDVWDPVYAAAQKASEWRAKVSARLEKIAGRMDTGEQENVLAAVIDGAAGKFHKLTPAQRASGNELFQAARLRG